MKKNINTKIIITVFSLIAMLLTVFLIAQVIILSNTQEEATDNTANLVNNYEKSVLVTEETDNSQPEVLVVLIEPTESIIPTVSISTTPVPTKKITVTPTTKAPIATTIAPTQTIVPTTVTNTSLPRQVSPGCPISTQNCVPCTSGTYCRFEAGYTSFGFLGWSCQNNNPGNIRPSAFRNGIIVNNGGTAPCGTRTDAYGRGDYMIFTTYNDGFNALKAYLTGISLGQHSSYAGTVNEVYQVCGECNLKLFSAKYVGTTIEVQNEPNSYANKIANRLGVNADTTMLNWIVANKLTELATAIKVNEGWYGD